jgi:citrate lyase subunit beta/citryl-CoA lyase/(S)-citramalyl-CoA lyase
MFHSARTCGADVALVDLEDSIAAPDKPAARTAAQQFFRPAGPAPACTLGLRMNSPTTLDGAEDLVTIARYEPKPAVILIPKVESARDLEVVAGALDTGSYTPDLWALIETPAAFDDLRSIMRAPRLRGVIFGSADYAAAVGCELSWEPLLYARSALVASATAAGLPAIDAPTFDLNDPDGLRREAAQAKQLGFYGKGVVHPRHAPIIREIFTPSEEEITQARAILTAARASGNRVTSVAGHMVGSPFFARAQALLRDADATSDAASTSTP